MKTGLKKTVLNSAEIVNHEILLYIAAHTKRQYRDLILEI